MSDFKQKTTEEIAIELGFKPDNYYTTATQMMWAENNRGMTRFILGGNGRRY